MKRNKFSLSNTKLFSCDMGELIPCGLFEVLPGDSVQMATSMLVRASPLLAPVMHPVDVRVHHWFVPFRLIWDDFEPFITGGPDGNDSTTWPFTTHTPGVGTLSDYLGLPTGTSQSVSVLPFRAYNLIWNENYRDQDLQSELAIDKGNGGDGVTVRTLQNVCWEKDYFTSARPWEQKGPSITLPLGTTAPVIGIGAQGSLTIDTNQTVRETTPSTTTTYPFGVDTGQANQMTIRVDSSTAATAKPLVFADLSEASAVTVNVLREALALQRFEEARARFGSRYTEYLRYLGIRSSDARLQRPEYLGGGRQTIQFSEVLQTGVTTSGTPNVGVGSLKGHGIAAMRSNRFRRFFEEHGLVMSLMSVRPKTMYMQGVPRQWLRDTKEMYWQKELETIGQQPVYNKEVYTAHASPTGEFGFQDRYDEYRRQESTVAGEFRESTLNFWHLAREFSSDPALNATFVSCVPTERIFASSSTDVLWCMAKHSIQARRLVSKTGRSMTF